MILHIYYYYYLLLLLIKDGNHYCIETKDVAWCKRCLNPCSKQSTLLPCSHSFCLKCIKTMKKARPACCPCCNQAFKDTKHLPITPFVKPFPFLDNQINRGDRHQREIDCLSVEEMESECSLSSLYKKRVKEINYWTKHSGFCYPPALFKSFVDEYRGDLKYQWTSNAILALQTLVEHHLISLLERANSNILTMKRIMLYPQDIFFAHKIQPDIVIDSYEKL